MTTFAQFSNNSATNGADYINARDQLTAFFENYQLYSNAMGGGLFYYDSAGLNIGFGYNITQNINTTNPITGNSIVYDYLTSIGFNISDSEWDAIESAANILPSNYTSASTSALAQLSASFNSQLSSIAASDANNDPNAPVDSISISQSQAYSLMNKVYTNIIDTDASKTFAAYNITPDSSYVNSITQAGLEDEFYNTDKGITPIAAFGPAAASGFTNSDIAYTAFETAFLTNSVEAAGLESRRLAEAFLQLGGTITLGLSTSGNPVVTGVNFSNANAADLVSFAQQVAQNPGIVTDGLYNQDNINSYNLGFSSLVSTLASQGYYVPQAGDIGQTSADTWANIAAENLNGLGVSATQLANMNAGLPGESLTAGGLIYVPTAETAASSPFNAPAQTGSGQAFVLDPTVNSSAGAIYTVGASLDPDAGDLFVENGSGSGDAVTFDESSYTQVSYSSDILSATITDESGATIGTFTSNVSADNNFSVDTGTSATNITVTGTGNLDTTSADTDLSADTLTFDGNSIAGTITSDNTDAYGRTYTRSGENLIIGSGSDTLTLDNFKNGDFGLTINRAVAADADGTGIIDSDTGLEWLPMADTGNYTYEQIVNGQDPQVPAGYTIASDAQVGQLFTDFGFPPGEPIPDNVPILISTVDDGGALAESFISLFGQVSEPGLSYGYSLPTDFQGQASISYPDAANDNHCVKLKAA